MRNFKQRTAAVAIGLLTVLIATPDVEAQSVIDTNSKLAESQAKLIAAQSSMLTAQAAMVTARANANKTNAEALQGFEQTKGLALSNNQKRVEAFYARRALHDDYQEMAKSRSRFVQSDGISSSKVQIPQRLNRRRLGEENYWPQALRRPEFSDYRLQISQLFAKGETTNTNSGINKAISEETKEIAAQMRAELLSLISQVSPTEYLTARKFIYRLVLEARFASVIEGIAISQ